MCATQKNLLKCRFTGLLLRGYDSVGSGYTKDSVFLASTVGNSDATTTFSKTLMV